MSILSSLSPRVVLKVLQKAGFVVIRRKGSHIRLIHKSDPTRYATVAEHGKTIPRRDIASILRQTKISTKEFLKLLKD
jgi:predicted RNA binding protein YcfA (HicA-like mRNA interferase family)